MKLYLQLLIIFLALIYAGCKSPQGFTDLTTLQVLQLIQKQTNSVIILDIRTGYDYRTGHIPGAINLDFFGNDFEEKLLALPSDKPILVYCQSGKRSIQAVSLLRAEGYPYILHYPEGFSAWLSAGHVLESTP